MRSELLRQVDQHAIVRDLLFRLSEVCNLDWESKIDPLSDREIDVLGIRSYLDIPSQDPLF